MVALLPYQIYADQKNITEKIQSRISAIVIEDVIGDQADSLCLKLIDPYDDIELPKTGANLSVSLGKDDLLYSFGEFVVDEINYHYPPALITIKATSVPFDQSSYFQSMQTQKVRSFSQLSLSQLIETIALEHHLSYTIDPSYSELTIDHENQINESNIAFLRRLAQSYNADFKLAYQRIIFLVKEGYSASNRKLPELALDFSDLTSIDYITQKRYQYGCVIVSYYDTDQACIKEAIIGDKAPIYRTNFIYESEKKAKFLAKRIMKDHKLEEDQLSFQVSGNLQIQAGLPIQINHLRDDIPNQWIITKAQHQITNQGYITYVSAKRRFSDLA